LSEGLTLEVTPKQVDQLAAVRHLLPEGTGVYITAIPGAPHDRLVEAAERIAAEGLRPIPHIAARGYDSLGEVETVLAPLRARAGVKEVLVIAGSLPRPVGEIDSSIQVLQSGLLEQHGIERVGVAGHPEGHPDVDAGVLAEAIEAKNGFAAESGLDTYIVTQFCFSAEPYIRYEQELRAAGNRLRVHPGVPGPASMSTLVKYGLACGVGASMRVLRKQARGLRTLLSPRPYNPEPLVLGIAEAVAADPASLFGSVHVYPFGAFQETGRWVAQLGLQEARKPRTS
jgi:methylenetetrahydrofolate reductase (NADPH)